MIYLTQIKNTILFTQISPWSFKVWSEATGSGRSASIHYPTMTKKDIQNLPVPNICEKDCVLLLWVTAPCLVEGLELVKNGVLHIKHLDLHGLSKIRKVAVYFGVWDIIQEQMQKYVYWRQKVNHLKDKVEKYIKL